MACIRPLEALASHRPVGLRLTVAQELDTRELGTLDSRHLTL